jgi:hypothetical protein
MPVFVIIGEKDMKEFLSESTKRANLEYWIGRNEAGRYDTPFGFHSDGRYRITTWANRDNIPLVRYALQAGRCHAPVPSDNTMLYDGFLCLWSRSLEGRLLYMGVEVG